ncbi:hypothetical protein F511_11882 [Dorcoceras hygrometricum]|uniref:Uncharacterized protein n=1 Tax=Dorcoceras hygrometricum TaxID=472368 RepID=A0A2Z7DG50_9LAMI|nr:hypothetical protein F511_11882 [Dorcoceras hygrometricum]
MSSPDYDLVVRSAESIDHSSTPEASNREDENPSLTYNYRARILRIDQDEARLTTQGCTCLYEVVIPHIHARAHRPPAGFHTFYINQIDRGLRFPLPTFIASLCHYIGVSPSQLAPNSYSSLLSLGILLKFHGIPLSTYVLMQLVTIKRLGPGKFYISNKKEFGFIGGNPSSHKGWMSRYFFIRRISGRENFWGCDMSWRDNAHTSPPSPPEQKPNLTKFLEAMRGKCFNAQQLIEEDLLCFFNFSGKKARLIGDLGDMMDKAAMLEALKERRSKTKSGGASSSGAQNKEETSSGAPSKEKREASPKKKERCKKRRHEKRDTGSTQESIPESLAWFGEAASQFSKAHAEVIKTKRSYDGVLGRHEVLLKELEEIQTKENAEKESLTAEIELARAEAQTYKAKAQSLETQVQSLDARAQCAEEESKLRLAEVEKLQEERENSWALEKEKFIKSKDFDSLCLKKAVMYFDKGFEGCLAQFRANGFSEEEYPASFLDVEQDLADMPEDQEEGSSGLGETPPA